MANRLHFPFRLNFALPATAQRDDRPFEDLLSRSTLCAGNSQLGRGLKVHPHAANPRLGTTCLQPDPKPCNPTPASKSCDPLLPLDLKKMDRWPTTRTNNSTDSCRYPTRIRKSPSVAFVDRRWRFNRIIQFQHCFSVGTRAMDQARSGREPARERFLLISR
jgi:hypothetical protein